jgi:hypothetical protein
VLSRERLELEMARFPEARNFFICVGTHHLSVFDDLSGLFEEIYEIHTAPGDSVSEIKDNSSLEETAQPITPFPEEEPSTP